MRRSGAKLNGEPRKKVLFDWEEVGKIKWGTKKKKNNFFLGNKRNIKDEEKRVKMKWGTNKKSIFISLL
jgi:hypothetical protein